MPPDTVVGSSLPSGPPGTITGVVNDRDGGPLAGVRLFVRGAAVEALTDADGRFALELPSGTWDLSAVRAGYSSETAAIEVVAHEDRAITLGLGKAGLALDDLRVTAPRITGGTASLLDERQDASTVSDVLGAEQMARSGDSDAAAALRRVTGLTVIGGKYVYVRGLGDRYSATLLNGSTLPSPEPEKRVVPLDPVPDVADGGGRHPEDVLAGPSGGVRRRGGRGPDPEHPPGAGVVGVVVRDLGRRHHPRGVPVR